MDENSKYDSQMRDRIYQMLRKKWGDLETTAGRYHEWRGSRAWVELMEEIKQRQRLVEVAHGASPQLKIKNFLMLCSDQGFELAIQLLPAVHERASPGPRMPEFELNANLKSFGIPLSLENGKLLPQDAGDQKGGRFGLPDLEAFRLRLQNIASDASPLSVIFLDLDNFKSVNDRFNHSVGDQVIETAIRVISQAIHGKGRLYHRSGDEMLVLLENFTLEEARAVGERIRAGIEQTNFPIVGRGLITSTLGVACCPETSPAADQLELLADQAAMRAKTLGKNRVLGNKDS